MELLLNASLFGNQQVVLPLQSDDHRLVRKLDVLLLVSADALGIGDEIVDALHAEMLRYLFRVE